MAAEGFSQSDPTGFDQVEDGTVFWTVSFYIAAEDLARELDTEMNSENWRTFAKDHDCSLLLGSAIDPLFNDIADRDIRGAVQDFLISAHHCDATCSEDSRERVLSEEKVTFLPPKQIAWTTEGIRFNASPEGLDAPRETEMKRFWFAHHGGALSYHLSFRYRYSFDENDNSADPVRRIRGAYSPATFYFLSALQKLVAPKELPLSPEELRKALSEAKTNPDGSPCPPHRNVFAIKTEIDLLDDFKVRGLAPKEDEGDLETTFWEGIRQRFKADASVLFERLRKQLELTTLNCDGPPIHRLLPTHPMIEVPGLGIPRCRYMFFFRDKRFFDRLLPPFAGEPRTRQMLVSHDSYRHYADLLSTRIKAVKQEMRKPLAERRGPVTVELDSDFWSEVADNPSRISDDLRRDGDEAGEGRADCLDYLFLSGFIQNIVDFMNQDVSEILDSTDPIYPDDETQASERFFVRFANHRAMTTFVEASRSLEVGNDYIGTCPYAFLIHILAMHNEYLDRIQEREIGQLIEDVEQQLVALKPEEAKNAKEVRQISQEIDRAKARYTRAYDNFRYHNPFRYDTEFAVFKKLEGLRGSERKREIQKTSLANLEDQASDAQRLIENAERDLQDKRDKRLNLGFTVIGLSALLSVTYSVATFHMDKCTLFGKVNSTALFGRYDLMQASLFAYVNPSALFSPNDWMKVSLIVEHLSMLLIIAVLLYLFIYRFPRLAKSALFAFGLLGFAIVALDLYLVDGAVMFECVQSAAKLQPG